MPSAGSPLPVAPSLKAMAAVSVLLLLGFYLFTFAVVAALLGGAGLAGYFGTGLGRIAVPVVLVIPALLLLLGVFSARPSPFQAPGRRLERADAPLLFETIESLATAVGTASPTDVYLDPLFTLAVTETGGFFRGRRVLMIGAPLLKVLSVAELRAGIAHELGHFAGGDTRVSGIVSYTHATFASVIRTAQRDPFKKGTSHYLIEGGLELGESIAKTVVATYAKLYFRVMHSLGRRQEVAADGFSTRIAGSAASARALQKFATSARLYAHYLDTDVGFALLKGAVPSDFWAGFERCRQDTLSTDAGRRFLESLRTAATDPYDQHPSLAERLRFFEEHRHEVAGEDDSPAATLLAPELELDAWLEKETVDRLVAAASAGGQRVPQLRRMKWSSIARKVYAPTALEAARKVAEALFPLYPDARTLGAMFARVVETATSGANMGPIVQRLSPAAARVPPARAAEHVGRVLRGAVTALFQGALLETGATVEESFGKPCLVFRAGDERVAPGDLALGAMQSPEARAALTRWGERLAAATVVVAPPEA